MQNRKIFNYASLVSIIVMFLISYLILEEHNCMKKLFYNNVFALKFILGKFLSQKCHFYT